MPHAGWQRSARLEGVPIVALMAGSPLISVEALRQLLDTAGDLVLLDVRWRLGAEDPRGEYGAGHLPGARYVDMESELSGPPNEQMGRHPLPSASEVQLAATRWGVAPNSLVVVYDDSAGLSAARAWWLLRWIGHERVHLLDGGLGAWRAAGGPLTEAEPPPPIGGPGLLGGRSTMPTVDTADICDGRVDVLLDARAAERFRGEHEPIDRVAGHIPGATSAPTTDNLDPGGCFLDADALRDRFDRLGVTPGRQVAVYCGSGVTAAHEVLALEIAGIRAALFPASWSGWIAEPTRPVAVGEE
jgi:thiosulfate/3-mercaptopyruvate sulfurtransferase